MWFVLGSGVILYIALLVILEGRNDASNRKAVQALAPPIMTVSPEHSPVPTSTLTGPERDATKQSLIAGPESDRQTREAHATSYALGTPYPFTTTFTTTVEPVLTPILGINGDCAQGNSRFSYEGCWTDRLVDGYIFVATGAPLADLSQGSILVYTTTLDLRTYGEGHWYQTPTLSGPVRPIEVTWPLLILGTTDDNPPILFTFDLLTRQWLPVSPTPSVLPTALP
jgi:hypothetical protein